MDKMLIIGAKGMLGQELCRVFAGTDLTAWDIGDIDIADEKDAREKISALAPDVIINAAAYNNVDRAESSFAKATEDREEKEKILAINGYAPGYLAKIAKDAGATLVHYSTDYVFNGEHAQGYGETDAPAPISAYGLSKFLGEREVQKNAEKYYIIRLSRLFGRPGGGKKSFVDTMLDLGKNKKELAVVDEEASSPTYAPDLAERTKFILDNALPHGIYHAANSGSCTWHKFAKEIFQLKNIRINLIKAKADDFPRPARRPKFSVLLNTELPEMRHWRDALAQYLEI